MSNSSARRPALADQRGAAFHRQLRLLAGGDLERQAGLPPHEGEEFRAIFGPAAGFGGDGAQAAHRAAREAGGTAVQRRHGAVHRHLAEQAGLLQALAEANDAAETVENAEMLADGRTDQQPAIVGAEVERREGSRQRPEPFRQKHPLLGRWRHDFDHGTPSRHDLVSSLAAWQGASPHFRSMNVGAGARVWQRRCRPSGPMVVPCPAMRSARHCGAGWPSVLLGDRSMVGQTTLTRFI